MNNLSASPKTTRERGKLHSRLRRPRLSLTAAISLLLAALALAVAYLPGEAAAQDFPPGGTIYYGEVTAGGVPAPDGHTIVARIGADYESEPVVVSGGKYESLVVAAPQSLDGQTIIFLLDGVLGDQADFYQFSGFPVIKNNYHLTFSGLPTPTPPPTAVPTNTPVAPPTPVPTSAPVATPTPETAAPMVFSSGFIILRGVAEVDLPDGSTLVARVGNYESEPAALVSSDGAYAGLVLDPGDVRLIGEQIRFFLNGVSARTTSEFDSGGLERDFDIVFTDYPTPTPTSDTTPAAAADTPVPAASAPTPTPEPTPTPAPTSTPAPTPTPEPTSTSVPTSTPVPTPTRESQTAPTATEPPQATQTAAPSGNGDPRASGCGRAEEVSPQTGAANALLLIAPLGLAVGMRRFRRK